MSMHTNFQVVHSLSDNHKPSTFDLLQKISSSKSNVSIYPTSFRDVISMILILTAMPVSVRMVVLVIYLLYQHANGDFKFKFKLNFFKFLKNLFMSSLIYYCLNYWNHYKLMFHFIIVLTNSIISNHLLGSITLSYYNLINNNSNKITTTVLISNHKFNCILYSLIIIYLHYILSYLNFYTIKLNRFKNSPLITIYFILNLQVILFEIFDNSFNKFDKKFDKSDSHILNQDISNQKFDKKITNKNEITSVSLSKSLSKSDTNNRHSSNSISIHSSSKSDMQLSNNDKSLLLSTANESKLDVNNNIPDVNCDSNKLLTIDLSSNASIGLNSGIFWNNLHNFIMSPFSSNLSKLSRKLTKFNDPTICFTTSTQSTSVTSSSFTTTTKSQNHTTIENIIILQPFWCLVAGLKSVYYNRSFLSSPDTNMQINNFINLSIVKICDSKVLIKFFNKDSITNFNSLKVKLNNLNWNFFKLFIQNNQCFLAIYDLTPHFKYEVELEYNEEIINRFFINTTNNNSALNESRVEASSLSTLQTLIVSVMSNYNNLLSKLKKLKKDENKKLTDLKYNIDSLKSKISKYNNNKPNIDNRALGRLKGLKHSVLQLEQEITDLKSTIDDLSQQEHILQQTFKDKENKLLDEIEQINQEIKLYDSRIKDRKHSLKNLHVENDAIMQKHQKLINKQIHKHEEIKQLKNDLKTMKKDIIGKFSKKIKKIHENYDLLPNLIDNIEILENEYSKFIESNK